MNTDNLMIEEEQNTETELTEMSTELLHHQAIET